MKLTRTRPSLAELNAWPMLDLPTRFNRLFEDYFGAQPVIDSPPWIPVVDITDANGELVLTAELPGIARKDVHITINDGVLTLKGEKKEEREEKDANYRLVERRFGSFERSFTLPASIDADRVNAKFKDGVLKIYMPKAVAALGKTIEIAEK